MKKEAGDIREISGLKREGGILAYIRKVWPTWFLLPAVALMTHGSILFTQRIGIDTEYIKSGSSNFDMLGRQGLGWQPFWGQEFWNPCI